MALAFYRSWGSVSDASSERGHRPSDFRLAETREVGAERASLGIPTPPRRVTTRCGMAHPYTAAKPRVPSALTMRPRNSSTVS